MARNKQQKHIPTKSKLKKDPGVPKLPDLKQKKNVEKLRAAQKAASPPIKDPDAPMASEPTLSSLAMLAEASGSNLGNVDTSDPSSSTSVFKAQLRRQYIRTLHKVIDESDIIVLVLDARDPEGCRSRLVEEEVRRREHEGKKLVFVLNKIDLVPRSNAEAWLRYLRHSTPTLPFKSSTQQQRTNLMSKTSPALLNLLKSYKKGAGSVTVGVVGYPNVGKSSLINSLKRAKVCAVAAEAGFTKEMQSVQIERGVRVLDSPGVVFDDDEQRASNILLRNVVKVEDIADPFAVVEQILAKSDHAKLSEIYKLPQFSSPMEFLTMLALSSGRLHRGGTPDILAAARQVIQDWNSQKIPYFSEPPTVHPSSVPATISAAASAKYGLVTDGTSGPTVAPGAEDVGQAQIVNQFAPTFNLGGLFSQADAGAFGASGDAEMGVEDAGEGEEFMDEDGNVMESDDLAPRIPRKRSRSRSPSPVPMTATLPPSTPSGAQAPDEPSSKRRRSLRSADVSSAAHAAAYDVPTGLATANPLNRRVVRRGAKAARKAERKRARKAAAGMEVDDSSDRAGLEFTFMARLDGVPP